MHLDSQKNLYIELNFFKKNFNRAFISLNDSIGTAYEYYNSYIRQIVLDWIRFYLCTLIVQLSFLLNFLLLSAILYLFIMIFILLNYLLIDVIGLLIILLNIVFL